MVETVNIYSRGAHAVVRSLSDDETIRFPRAQLAREEFVLDKMEAIKLFYGHIIASALFPDNFVEVAGLSMIPNFGLGGDVAKRGGKSFGYSLQ